MKNKIIAVFYRSLDQYHTKKAQRAQDPTARTYHNMKHWEYFNKTIEAEEQIK